MFAAVRANDLGTLKKLLSEGASLKDREGGKSVLCECVQQNNVDAVKLLFEFGASIDEGETVETTPLLLAIRKKSDELVELLLSNGANPNVAVKVANVVQTYEEGSWPLLEASISGRFSTVHSLLQKGADINFAPFDKHPATEAFIRNHHHIASYLIHQIVGLDKSTIGAKYKPTSDNVVDSGALQNLQQRFAALLKREIIGDILFSPPVVQSASNLIEEFQPEQKAKWKIPLQKAKSNYNRTNLLIKKKGKVGINPFAKKASKEKMDLWDSDSKLFKEQLDYTQAQHDLYTNLASNSLYISQKFTEACNTVDDLRDIVDKVVQNPNSPQANAIVEHIKRLTDYNENFQKRAGNIVQGTVYLEEAHKNVQQIHAAAVRERNARMINGMCSVASGVTASSSAQRSLRSAESSLTDSTIQLNGLRARVKLGADFETNWARAQQYLPDLDIGLEATDNRTRLANYKVGVPRVSDWSRYLQLHQLLIDGIIQAYQNSLVLWKVWAVEQNIGNNVDDKIVCCPDHITSQRDESGRRYYVDNIAKKTSWNLS